jgi:hypothetical protein
MIKPNNFYTPGVASAGVTSGFFLHRTERLFLTFCKAETLAYIDIENQGLGYKSRPQLEA